MITIFNRVEAFITRDLNELNRVRDILSANKIEHVVSTNSITNPGRHHGIPNMKPESAYQYRVFVYKNDSRLAETLIKNRN